MSMTGTRLALTALSLIGLIVAVLVAIYYASDAFVYDAHAYWLSDGYGRASQETDAFSYSPPILLLFQAIRAVMPWEVFAYVYSIAIALGIWVLAGPFTLLVVFMPHVATEISLGNIHIFLALVTVFGLRWPWLWSFVLLTKVTPGVGLVWFAVRREWRSLWIALGVTALIALPTVVLYPQLWADWIRVVTDAGPGAGGGLLPRVLGAAIVAVGAWRNWPWLVPVGSMLALPVLWSLHGFSMLVAVLWYVRKAPLPLPQRADAPVPVRRSDHRCEQPRMIDGVARPVPSRRGLPDDPPGDRADDRRDRRGRHPRPVAAGSGPAGRLRRLCAMGWPHRKQRAAERIRRGAHVRACHDLHLVAAGPRRAGLQDGDRLIRSRTPDPAEAAGGARRLRTRCMRRLDPPFDAGLGGRRRGRRPAPSGDLVRQCVVGSVRVDLRADRPARSAVRGLRA